MSWQARELGIRLDDLQRERPAGSWQSLTEAANFHFVSTQTVYRAIQAGKIQAIKDRGRWLVLVEDAERLWRHAA